MAGIATHLIIAREIIKLLPKGTIKEEGLFYAGSIAPDAIHARESFVRADKKHTHLRDDIKDRDFLQTENLELFHQRVADFILKHRDRKDSLLDLYRGYVVHILTDELYILTIRQEFIEDMKALGIDQNDLDFYHLIVTDMNRNDLLLTMDYEDMDVIGQELEKVGPHEVKDLLSERELTDSRNWVLHRYFEEEHERIAPVYISYERTLEFVGMAAEDIVRRLCGRGELPRMF